jgi:hypothetical protein
MGTLMGTPTKKGHPFFNATAAVSLVLSLASCFAILGTRERTEMVCPWVLYPVLAAGNSLCSARVCIKLW